MRFRAIQLTRLASLLTASAFLFLGPLSARTEYGFSEPQPLNADAFTDDGPPADPDFDWDAVPAILNSGSGGWIALWASYNPVAGGENPGNDFDIHYALSADDALAWTPPRLLNANGQCDSGHDALPQICHGFGGRLLAIWVSRNNLAANSAGDKDIQAAISDDGGNTWSAPSLVNTTGSSDQGNDDAPQIESEGAGTLVAVWQSDGPMGGAIGPDFDILSARSADNGDSWSSPTAVNAFASIDSARDMAPDIAWLGGTHWVVIWASEYKVSGDVSSDMDLMIAHSYDNGLTWSGATLLLAAMTTDTLKDGITGLTGVATVGPRIARDKHGNVAVIYQFIDTIPGRTGLDQDIACAVSGDSGASWSGPFLVNSTALCDSQHDGTANIVADGSDWLAVWSSANLIPQAPNLNIAISRSTDGGRHWSPQRSLNLNQGMDAAGVDDCAILAPGENGMWLAVWTSNQPLIGGGGNGFYGEYEILFARSTALGPMISIEADAVDLLLGRPATSCDVNNDGLIDIGDVIATLK